MHTVAQLPSGYYFIYISPTIYNRIASEPIENDADNDDTTIQKMVAKAVL